MKTDLGWNEITADTSEVFRINPDGTWTGDPIKGIEVVRAAERDRVAAWLREQRGREVSPMRLAQELEDMKEAEQQ